MPEWKPEIVRCLAPLNLAPAREAEITEELAQHLEDRYQELLASGKTDDQAFQTTIEELKDDDLFARSLKSVEKKKYREPIVQADATRSFFAGVVQDVCYGLRMLRKELGFTTVAVLTLALGIGANMAVFSMVDTLMLRPLPIDNPHQMTVLAFPRDATHFDDSFSKPEFREITAETAGVFSQLSAMIMGGAAGAAGPTARPDGLTVDGVTRPVQTLFVSGNFFQMLGIRPYLGRFILPSEGQTAGADPVAVLSYRYWHTRFHGDRTILDRSVFINGHPVTIVGIAPNGFLGPTPLIEMEAYLPLGMATLETSGNTNFLADPKTRELLVLARLRSDISIERANALLATVGQHIAKEYPRNGVEAALHARFLKPPGLISGPNPFPALAGLFMTLSGLVLALACINVTNLLLVRAAGRRREMAVRTALGGSRARLIQQLLSESVLLALVGAGAGIVAGTLALRALSGAAIATDVPFVLEFPFNARVFAYSVCIAVLAGVIVGFFPALRVLRGQLSEVLHDGGRTSTGRGQRMRTVLVSAQVAGSFALLVAAGLFTRSLRNAQNTDLGFNPRNVLNVKLDPGEIGYTKAQTTAFYDQLLRQVRALPGVQSASLAMMVPLADDNQGDEIDVPDSVKQKAEQPVADYNAVSPYYFKTLKITLLQGRDFSELDSESSPRVALINEAMAERFWQGQNAVGREFTRGHDRQRVEIIGVVKNSRIEDTYSPYGPAFYVPLSQNFSPAQTLQIRTAGPPQAIAPEVISIIRRVAPAAPLLSVRAMTDAVNNGGNGLFLFNLGAEISGALGLLGLTLAVVGVYGVMAYAVSQRTQEIGVRMALGAQRNSILWMVSRQGLVIATIGLAVGIIAALGIARLVGDFLVGVSPTDALTYSIVSLLLMCVALLACCVPARRAMRVDPMVALRHE